MDDRLIEFARVMHKLAKKYNIDIKTTEQQELTPENLDKFFKKMEDVMESERKIPSIPPEYLMIINDDNQDNYRVFKVEKDRTGECAGYTVMAPNVSPDVIKKLDDEYEVENIKRKYLSPKIPMENNNE